jgi:5-methylthioadenosine/S-adenosylhomocysteine deaminase
VPQACDLLISGGLMLALDDAGTILADGAIAIAGDRIVACGATAAIERDWTAARRIDARSRLVMPGLVNIHNHTPLMITRGMIEDLGFAPMYTPTVPQGHALSAEEAYALARLGGLELLCAGSTTIVDYYRYPGACARAHAELGLRAVIGGRIHDADSVALAAGRRQHRTAVGVASLAESAALIEDWDGAAEGRIRCDVAPHAADTCSADLLREVAALAARHGRNVHTHLAQSAGEVAYVKERDGRSPAELFDELGLLDARLIAGHCIWLEPDEIARVGRAGVTVAHSPIGNAKSGMVAPVLALEEAGARIALCTDTMSGDLFEAMRWALAVARIRGAAFEPKAADVLRWATRNGAAALGLGAEIGSLEIGKKADLVLLDLDAPNLAPIVDGIGVVVHAGSGRNVDTVIIDGRIVLEGGRPTYADAAEIVGTAQRVAEGLWRRHGTRPVTVQES